MTWFRFDRYSMTGGIGYRNLLIVGPAGYEKSDRSGGPGRIQNQNGKIYRGVIIEHPCSNR